MRYRAAIFAAALAATAVFAGPAAAAQIDVRITADEWALPPELDQGCGLREAVAAAELDTAVGGCRAGSGTDEIRLGPGNHELTEILEGPLVIDTDVVIAGAGSGPTAIDAHGIQPQGGVVVPSGRDVGISELRITGGSRRSNALIGGGGILNRGTLTLTGVVITGNEVFYDGQFSAHGGGIYNSGSLTLRDSWVVSNRATPGDASGRGAGIFNGEEGAVHVVDSVVHGNDTAGGKTGYGAGLYNHIGSMTIDGSLISANVVPNTIAAQGGGIYNSSDGTLAVHDSLISENRALGFTPSSLDVGGGIYAEGPASIVRSLVSGNRANDSGGIHVADKNMEVEILNSTISGNVALGTGGGLGIHGPTVLNNVTVSGNSADADSEDGGEAGGLRKGSSGNLSIYNSVIAGNTDHTPPGGEITHDCLAIFEVEVVSHSLLGDPGPACPVGSASANLVPGTAPLLRPLADNGGPSRTQALTPTSPLIGAGHPGAPGSGIPACETTDQRGVERAVCDVGAWQSPAEDPGPVDTSGPSGDGGADAADHPPGGDGSVSIVLEADHYKARSGKNLRLTYITSHPGKVKAVLKGTKKKTRRFKAVKKTRTHDEAGSFTAKLALKSKPKKRPKAKRRPLPKGPYKLKLKLTTAAGEKAKATAALKVRRAKG